MTELCKPQICSNGKSFDFHLLVNTWKEIWTLGKTTHWIKGYCQSYECIIIVKLQNLMAVCSDTVQVKNANYSSKNYMTSTINQCTLLCMYTGPTILVDWASTFTALPHSYHYCLYWTFSKSMSLNVNVQTVKPFSTTQRPRSKPSLSPLYYSSIVLTFDTHCIACEQQLHPAREMLSIARDISLMCESLKCYS